MRNDIFFCLRKHNLLINALFENIKSSNFFLNYNSFFAKIIYNNNNIIIYYMQNYIFYKNYVKFILVYSGYLILNFFFI